MSRGVLIETILEPQPVDDLMVVSIPPGKWPVVEKLEMGCVRLVGVPGASQDARGDGGTQI